MIEKSKSQLRIEIKALRKSLQPVQITAQSRQVCARFESALSSARHRSLVVGLYRPFQGEMDPGDLVPIFHQWGWKVCYPRITHQSLDQMEFVEISPTMDAEASWKLSPYGFREPHPELPSIDPAQLELIFIPGVAYGCSGERLGRGAGHYDRFIPKLKDCLRVAMAYDFQIFPHLEQESWDQPVHWWMTEKREWRAAEVEQWLERKK